MPFLENLKSLWLKFAAFKNGIEYCTKHFKKIDGRGNTRLPIGSSSDSGMFLCRMLHSRRVLFTLWEREAPLKNAYGGIRHCSITATCQFVMEPVDYS